MEVGSGQPQLLRRVNSDALLRVMREIDVVTGTELIERTGLTRATVISICDELIEAGWVQEAANQREAGGYMKGRPARRFQLNPSAGYVLGIDVGAAKTTVLVADLRGETRSRKTVPFPENQPARRAGVVQRAVAAALDGAGIESEAVLAATIGVAAPVSREGKILRVHQFWRNFDQFREALADRRGWRVRVENDANLAALAERWIGAAQGIDDLVVLLAGVRMGAGVMESGRLLHGSQGGFGELEFLATTAGVGSSAGLGTVARQLAIESLATNPTTLLRDLCHGAPETVTAEMVFVAAAADDHTAQSILDRLATRMARVIGAIATILNPELVVISGAVAPSAAVLLGAIAELLPQFSAIPPRLAVSTLAEAVVATGAVRDALDYVEANALAISLNRRDPQAERGAPVERDR